jgi:DNA-binding IclR family transcriptional regulator
MQEAKVELQITAIGKIVLAAEAAQEELVELENQQITLEEMKEHHTSIT